MSADRTSPSTAASRGSEPLVVQSHAGPYQVDFTDEVFPVLAETARAPVHFLMDAKVASLYKDRLAPVLSARSVVLIEATEENKSLEALPRYVQALVSKGVRRSESLVAVGGGILQDITCFLAATVLRGLEWRFFPTTLLAQSDSCIGSKSSINACGAKNLLGTFTPPRRIVLSTEFLGTLEERELQSGVGEMLKVHAIESPESFDRIAADYARLFTDRGVLRGYLRRSLEIKRRLIEADEFDRGIRNVLNYGHTFGHAIESATRYAVPHGIAVTIGADMANFAAARLGRMDAAHHRRMHPTLAANYAGYESLPVPFDAFLAALSKDKKNTADRLGLILPDASGRPEKALTPNNEAFRVLCREYLETGRHP